MGLTQKEKNARKRKRMIETSRQYTTGSFSRKFVAPIFQRAIRAEAAALPAGLTPAIVNGELKQIYRYSGQCCCITCGKIGLWNSGLGGFHTGHFLSSRCNSILFEEENVAPQCCHCNMFDNGAPQEYRLWMELTRGKEVVERLKKLKKAVISFSREELVDMRIGYANRLKAAEEKMKTW